MFLVLIRGRIFYSLQGRWLRSISLVPTFEGFEVSAGFVLEDFFEVFTEHDLFGFFEVVPLFENAVHDEVPVDVGEEVDDGEDHENDDDVDFADGEQSEPLFLRSCQIGIFEAFALEDDWPNFENFSHVGNNQ